VEVWFLNWLRPRLFHRAWRTACGSRLHGSDRDGVIVSWVSVGALVRQVDRGLAFIGIELMAHLVLQLAGAQLL
jgi:hypothetical protein